MSQRHVDDVGGWSPIQMTYRNQAVLVAARFSPTTSASRMKCSGKRATYSNPALKDQGFVTGSFAEGERAHGLSGLVLVG